jgi:hypothetical protein
MTKDILLLIVLAIIDIAFLIGSINGTIILNSVFSIIGFILVEVTINYFIIKLIKIILS